MKVKKKIGKKSVRYNSMRELVSIGLGLFIVIIFGVLFFNFINHRKNRLSVPGIDTYNDQVESTPETATQHIVVEGDTLWSIADKYYHSGNQWISIASANALSDPDNLAPGQKLYLPKISDTKIDPQKTIDTNSYMVQQGDNLWSIAVRAYGDGYKWPQIAEKNLIRYPDMIYPGQLLTLPTLGTP